MGKTQLNNVKHSSIHILIYVEGCSSTALIAAWTTRLQTIRCLNHFCLRSSCRPIAPRLFVSRDSWSHVDRQKTDMCLKVEDELVHEISFVRTKYTHQARTGWISMFFPIEIKEFHSRQVDGNHHGTGSDEWRGVCGPPVLKFLVCLIHLGLEKRWYTDRVSQWNHVPVILLILNPGLLGSLYMHNCSPVPGIWRRRWKHCLDELDEIQGGRCIWPKRSNERCWNPATSSVERDGGLSLVEFPFFTCFGAASSMGFCEAELEHIQKRL